jgi:segregation and condensation protein A
LSFGDVALSDLLLAVQSALELREEDPAVDEVVSPVTVTISQQMDKIRDRLHTGSRVRFREFLAAANSRMEVIVTFMAILELIKQTLIDVEQDTPFGDILIVAKPVDLAAAAARSEIDE